MINFLVCQFTLDSFPPYSFPPFLQGSLTGFPSLQVLLPSCEISFSSTGMPFFLQIFSFPAGFPPPCRPPLAKWFHCFPARFPFYTASLLPCRAPTPTPTGLLLLRGSTIFLQGSLSTQLPSFPARFLPPSCRSPLSTGFSRFPARSHFCTAPLPPCRATIHLGWVL